MLLVLSLAMALLVGACGDDEEDEGGGSGTQTTAQAELTKVTFVDAAPFKINLFPFNVADQAGFFREEGLEVDLQPIDGTSLVVQQVAAGRAEFGYGGSEGLLLGASQNAGRFHAFYDLYNTGTFQIYAPADSGMTSAEDLAGKKIGVEAPDTGEAIFTRIIAANASIDSDDVELVSVGEETANEIAALEDGRVDAVTGPVDTLVGAEAKDIQLTCLTCDLPQPASSAVIVNAEFAEENRDKVAAFGRALAKATLYGQENPDAALEIMREAAPEQFTDEQFAKLSLEKGLEQLEMPKYGEVDREKWDIQLEYLQRPEAKEVRVDKPVDLDAFLMSDLVDQINDFDAEAVKSKAAQPE